MLAEGVLNSIKGGIELMTLGMDLLFSRDQKTILVKTTSMANPLLALIIGPAGGRAQDQK
jgi:hypothetical protein